MKHYYLLAAAALTLAGCASDEDLGSVSGQSNSNEISFSASNPNMTRATGEEAAEKLNKEFVVLGWKSNGWKDGATGAAGSYTDGVNKVFDNYTVHYDGNSGSTESNSKGWEYVGYTSQPVGSEGVNQSIKFWDYSYSQYDFIAWSLTGSAKLQEIKTDGVNPYKIHQLIFTAPTAADLANVYVSNQETVLKEKYKETVTLTFRSMASKVRVGIYETVPGYSVKDVKFYTEPVASGATETTPASETKATLYVNTGTPFAKAGTVTAMYRDSLDATTVNDVVVSTAASESDSKVQFGTFTPAKTAEYKESTSDKYLGRTSNEATLSNGGEFSSEFPMAATEMVLKVDYTLVSTDGSCETIKVTGAKATVPANYGEWKANYAYTYLFKISDKTNGSTSGKDPDVDPTVAPEGLYPITFDACVVAVQDGNTQETITTVATPSITTYQNGSAITSDNEYQASTSKHIFVTAAGINLTTSNTKLYTAIDLGKDKEGITENTVDNYANNDILLSDASAKLSNVADNKIPASETIDGVAISLSKSAVQFYPEANTTYVVEITNGGVKSYKVIRVESNSNTATYTLAVKTTGTETIAEGGSTIITVVDANGYKVTGAKNCFDGASDFTVTEGTAGEYTFVAKAGTATGNKSISLNSSDALTIKVNAYTFSADNVDVTEGTETSTIKLQLGGSDIEDLNADTNFTITGTGLSIKSVAKGEVTIKADAGAESGKITFKNGSVEVASANITVKSYALAASPTIINKGEKSTLTLTLGGAATTGVVALTSSNTTAIASTTATTTGNTVEVEGLAKGTATFSNADFKSTATVEVVDFAITLYTDAACTDANKVADATNLTVGTYYAKFTDGGNPTSASLTAQGCSLAGTSTTGVYEVTVTTTGTATIKYTYKGVTFTLVSKTVN